PAPRERAIDRLVDRLRDANHRVREAAVTGLRLADAGGAAAAIEAYAKPLATQFRVPHEKTADALRRGRGSKKLASLEKEVSDLQDKLRKLQAAVDKLGDRAAGDGDNGAKGEG
ncbi:MAG: hypothetical protein KC486_22040, partial [Myxococcales bacterium]|nr:hypothetical protein [Myxococcales bacterium]